MELVDTLIKEKMIRVREPAADWKEAVKLGIGLLVSAGKVTWDYYQAIIKSAQKNGPYFVLAPGIALPHARPEEGVIESGFSLVTLQTPVNMNSHENDPIGIFLSFAATDATDQVERYLADAVSLFEDENRVREMMDATTIAEMHTVLHAIAKANKP